MKENEDYKFRVDMDDKLNDSTIPIELITPLYKGVVYRYLYITFVEDDAENASIKFEYEIIDPKEHVASQLEEDQVFKETIGLILNSIILDVIEEDYKNAGNNVSDIEIGKSDIEELDNE